MNPDTEENRRSEPERRPSSESSDQKGKKLGWVQLVLLARFAKSCEFVPEF